MIAQDFSPWCPHVGLQEYPFVRSLNVRIVVDPVKIDSISDWSISKALSRLTYCPQCRSQHTYIHMYIMWRTKILINVQMMWICNLPSCAKLGLGCTQVHVLGSREQMLSMEIVQIISLVTEKNYQYLEVLPWNYHSIQTCPQQSVLIFHASPNSDRGMRVCCGIRCNGCRMKYASLVTCPFSVILLLYHNLASLYRIT